MIFRKRKSEPKRSYMDLYMKRLSVAKIIFYFIGPLLSIGIMTYTYFDQAKPFFNRSLYGELCQKCKTPFFPKKELCPVCSNPKKKKRKGFEKLVPVLRGGEAFKSCLRPDEIKKNFKNFGFYGLLALFINFLFYICINPNFSIKFKNRS